METNPKGSPGSEPRFSSRRVSSSAMPANQNQSLLNTFLYQDLRTRYLKASRFLKNPALTGIRGTSMRQWLQPRSLHLMREWVDCEVRELVDVDFFTFPSPRPLDILILYLLVTALEDAAQAKHETTTASPTPQREGPRVEGLIESRWREAKDTVFEMGYGDEWLGRFALSLSDLPRDQWEVALNKFEGVSLHDLQTSRCSSTETCAILETFLNIEELLPHKSRCSHLSARIRPSFAYAVETWCQHVLTGRLMPDMQAVENGFLMPILFQILKDSNSNIVQIAKASLALEAPRRNPREIAARLNVDQIEIEHGMVLIASIIKVRWSEGQYLMDDLCETCGRFDRGDTGLKLLLNAFQLFFPERRYQRLHSSKSPVAPLGADTPTPNAFRFPQNIRDVRSSGRAKSPSSFGLANAKAETDKIPVSNSSSYIHEAILSLLDQNVKEK